MVSQENRCEDELTGWWDLLKLGHLVISSYTVGLFIQFQFPELYKCRKYVYI